MVIEEFCSATIRLFGLMLSSKSAVSNVQNRRRSQLYVNCITCEKAVGQTSKVNVSLTKYHRIIVNKLSVVSCGQYIIVQVHHWIIEVIFKYDLFHMQSTSTFNEQ